MKIAKELGSALMEELMTSLHLHVMGMAFSALFAAISFVLAYSWGFFTLPSRPLVLISWKTCGQVFLLFLLLQFFIIPLFLLLGVHHKGYSLANVETAGWVNIVASFALAVILVLFLLWFMPGPFRNLFYSKRPVHDILLGCMTWCIAFPAVLVFSLLMQIIFGDFLGFQLEDQIAVKQIKAILPYPKLFVASIVMVAFIIPVIEEILFRGFLQTALRGYFGPFAAITLCSLIFALFHFSWSQGMNNFNIVGSLFFLSLFLGFLRERQGNLLAPIAMHSTFNALSILMVLYLN